VATILGGICAVLALAISLVSIGMTLRQQQQAEADEAERKQQQAEGRKAEFAAKITIWRDPRDKFTEKLIELRYSNTNPLATRIWVRKEFDLQGKNRTFFYSFMVGPCERGVLPIPEENNAQYVETIAVPNPRDDWRFWQIEYQSGTGSPIPDSDPDFGKNSDAGDGLAFTLITPTHASPEPRCS
jgi:hypothetical protein